MLTQYVELPNRPDGSFVGLLSLPVTGNDYTAKIDHQFSQSNRLTVRFYRNGAQGANSEFSSASSAGKGLGATPTNLVQTETIKLTQVINPRLLNEAMFSHLRVDPIWAAGPAIQSPKQLGGNYNYDGPYPLTPFLITPGRFNIGSFLFFQEPDDTFVLSDKVNWELGRHSIAAGAEIQRLRHVTQAQVFSGLGIFVGAFTGNAVADYLLGRSVLFQGGSFLDDASRGGNYHFFVRDDFKIGPRLTLNLGVRYELNTPWVQVHDHTANVLPGQQSQKIPAAPPGVVYPGDPGVPRGLIPADKNNFSPRIGFAWDPTGTGRTSIRAAFGVFVNYTGAIFSSTNNSGAAPYQATFTTGPPPTFSDPWRGGTDPFPYVVDTQNPTFIYPLLAFRVNPNFRDGYIQQWNLNVQRQIGDSLLVQAGYFGLAGHKLPGAHDSNQPVFGPGATALNAQVRRPYFPQFFGPIYETTSDTNSSYHSLQMSVNKKFSQGYTLELAYTFSKSIDDSSSAAVDAARGNVQDGTNYLSGQRGLSDFDQRHILAVNGIWELPFMKRNRFLGGWRLAGLTRYASGTPFSVFSGSDTALIGTPGAQRTDVTGDWRLDPNRSHGELVAKYFDTSAFAQPAIGQFGNSGRNIVIGPGYFQTDVSLQKKFKLPGERGGIEFRGDFFNLFNQVNFNNPTNTFVSPAFGRILSARDARIAQLSLRYDF